MTQSSVLFVARLDLVGLFLIAFAMEVNRSVESAFCVCVRMATNFLELATTLKYLLSQKKS